jgi:multiple sugar transport system ATP-binding protein
VASVELRNIRKTYGKVEAVREVSLEVADRELVVFVGPSGCGKSTLLRMIAGLEEISGGELFIGGQLMNKVPAADRGIAMVFQSYALYPHMTVAENMGFALKMMGIGRAEVEDKVREAARILQLEGLLDRKPRQLSGGQRQRVAIGRAITRSPSVFLFDEPLSNLDADLRAQMRIEIARLHDELRTTMIYVTHDQVEAMTLADRIVVLNDGAVEQQGQPLELYQSPANRFVAGFLGQPKINLARAKVTQGPAGATLSLGDGSVLIPAPAVAGLSHGDTVEVGIRPDALSIGSGAGFAARVVVVERLGSTTLLHVQPRGLEQLLTVEAKGIEAPEPGREVVVRVDPAGLHLFALDGTRMIGSGPPA